MCMVDGCEDGRIWPFWDGTRVARRDRRCEECRAVIKAGDVYHWYKGRIESERFWVSGGHCVACHEGPCAWLTRECTGFVYTLVYDDLAEHWNEGVYGRGDPQADPVKRLALGRMMVAMERRGASSVY